jgi:hypothetical protein
MFSVLYPASVWRELRAPVIFLPVTFRSGQADSGTNAVGGGSPGQLTEDPVGQHAADFRTVVIVVADAAPDFGQLGGGLYPRGFN